MDNFLSFIKRAFIKKMPDGKYKVLSEKGKNLGVFPSREKAEKHLREIEFFKHKKKKASKDLSIDLTSLEELSYSAIMRELRKQCDPNIVQEFQTIFKKLFDALVLHGEDHPAEKAMPATIVIFSKKYKVEINND